MEGGVRAGTSRVCIPLVRRVVSSPTKTGAGSMQSTHPRPCGAHTFVTNDATKVNGYHAVEGSAVYTELIPVYCITVICVIVYFPDPCPYHCEGLEIGNCQTWQ